jgi:hypothetical protein
VREDEGVRGPAVLLVATAALALAAALVLLLPGRRDDGVEFQRLVRGVGLGAATDLSRCAAAFDPRDGGACSLRHDPVPCGSLLCPVHD